MPDLCGPGRTARSAAAHSARPVVHPLAREPSAARRRAHVDCGYECRLSLVSGSVEEAPRDRPRDRPRRASVLSATPRAGAAPAGARPLFHREGARCRRRRSTARRRRCGAARPRSDALGRRAGTSLGARASRFRAAARGTCDHRRCRSAGGDRFAVRDPRCIGQQHACRCSRQGGLRGRCCMSARARLEPGLRRAARSRAAIRALGSRSARRADPREERTILGHRLRERVAAGHSVQSWARGILEAAGLS